MNCLTVLVYMRQISLDEYTLSLYKFHAVVRLRLHVPSTLLFVSGTFDFLMDKKNGCATHFPIKVSVTIGTMLNFDGDFFRGTR